MIPQNPIGFGNNQENPGPVDDCLLVESVQTMKPERPFVNDFLPQEWQGSKVKKSAQIRK